MFFDKNTHIINISKPLGFDEKLVQEALDYHDDYGNDKTYQWLVNEKKMDAAKATELLTLFKKELKIFSSSKATANGHRSQGL